ncbi:MAG TPA: hypothetical protein VGQ19_04475, partial [Burkholderiales bacterium]|nr:hypothetical protein [Burkholderiales bacterium]
LVLAAALSVVTWPQARFFGSHVVQHSDPYLSMWRLSWFAHAVESGVSLADANIFYPEKGSFTYSDTTFLQGVLGAPFLWLGISKVLVYNVLLACGFLASGLAFFIVMREFGIGSLAAMVGAVIFTVAPARMDHIMHLELQWFAAGIAAIGLTVMLALRPSARAAAGLAAALALQFASSVYYAVYLVPLLGIVWAVCLPNMPDIKRTLRLTVIAAIASAILVSPLAALYIRRSAVVEERTLKDMNQFSALPINYLATPPQHLMLGQVTQSIGPGERRLFPGVLALVLAITCVKTRRRYLAAMTLLFTAIAFDLSLGMNGSLYPWFYKLLPAWRGLRAPARYGGFFLLGVSALAAMGWDHLLARIGGVGRRRASVLTGVLIAALSVEYLSPTNLVRVGDLPGVYVILNRLPPGVVLEYPTPAPDTLNEIQADYEYWSTFHWRPLINGYSGYYPTASLARERRLRAFPSDVTLAELKQLNVRYAIIHPWAITGPRRAVVLRDLAIRKDVEHLGSFLDWQGDAEIFAIR